MQFDTRGESNPRLQGRRMGVKNQRATKRGSVDFSASLEMTKEVARIDKELRWK